MIGHDHLAFVAVLLICASSPALGQQNLTDGPKRQCYSCTSIEEPGGQCEINPAGLAHGILANCNRPVCTIVRVEEWPSRRVKSFYRGCDARTKMFEQNQCVIEGKERTCFTACVGGDLCNAGDGLISNDIHPSSTSGSVGGCWSSIILVSFISVVVIFLPL